MCEHECFNEYIFINMCLLFLHEKYIIPEKGKKDLFAIVNDAWRQYKHLITKYNTMRERLKNRP